MCVCGGGGGGGGEEGAQFVLTRQNYYRFKAKKVFSKPWTELKLPLYLNACAVRVCIEFHHLCCSTLV